MSRLILHAQHAEQGACFAPYGAWEVPEHYGHPNEEYLAVRERVGLSDLSPLGRLLVSGPDRFQFLQSIVSNDLHLLQPNRAIYSTLLSAKGKVLSAFYIYPLEDAFLLEMDQPDDGVTAQHLTRYKFRSKVTIDRPSWGRLSVSGPNAGPLLTPYFSDLPTEEGQFLSKQVNGISAVLIRRCLHGEEGYQIYIQETGLVALWERLVSVGREVGLLPVGHAALEILRIEAGQLRYGVDMDDQTIPIEAGLESIGISYAKGCYPGQEVLARIQTYGHVNKHLSGLIIEGNVVPVKGDRIFQQDVDRGWITSATLSPTLKKVIAMGYVRSECAVPGTQVDVKTAQSRCMARTVILPFYRRF